MSFPFRAPAFENATPVTPYSQEKPDMSFGTCDTNVAQNFSRFVRRAFPVAAAANLAAITGQTPRAAERQLAGEVKPSADALAACIAAFGPAFVAAVFDARWAEDLARTQRRETLLGQLAQLDAANAADGPLSGALSGASSGPRVKSPLSAGVTAGVTVHLAREVAS